MRLTTTQKKENNIVELEIAVGAEDLKAATDKVFRQKVKSINVPGFRKGKAPRAIIEKVYGGGIFMQDAVDELYPAAYEQAIEEMGIEPVENADVELVKLDQETGFTFKARVTVKPEVQIGEYKGLKAEKAPVSISDTQIDGQIERLRERNARIIEVDDRAAQDGDVANIDFEGFVDGVAFEGGKAEGSDLTLGSHQFIAGFEEQIVGKNIGDTFDVEVTFPEEYHAEELQGKPAVFKVKLNAIKSKELPELDDEFAKDVSEFDTLDELKADIREKLQQTQAEKAEEEVENQLMDQILAHLEADIPECMYEHKITEGVQEFSYRLSAQGMNLEMYLQYTGMDMEQFRESFREQAIRQVKIRLALEKIAQLEGIVCTEEDYQAELVRIAELYEVTPDRVALTMARKDMEGDFQCTKAIDIIHTTAEVTEKAPEDKEAPATEEN